MTGAAAERGRPVRRLARRWPAALGLALPALTLPGGDGGETVAALAEVLPLLALVYVAVCVIGQRRVSWPALGVGSVLLVGARAADVAPSTVFIGIALLLLVWGAVSGTPLGRTVFGAQAAGMIAFGAVALAALAADPEIARYLVGAGWLLHGVWDFVHLRLNRVVSRSYAEWCGVTDVLMGLGLILLL
ncbi:hypothetical protein Arub01_09180 [Actinomadura rubrobrunea]|uniref:Uncharacterized protein n=1 Tax=Actinomadura rubrobrunea TaxID=115335 RepID=A0A9W6UTF1_9ACTN|nr:hypothetical protein [Actinomadura rubrobrunea]GLW62674.1 hypothetical protein Arub01_09180 [Actinomadura rubrobrunea]